MNATSVLSVYNTSKQCLQDFINIPLLFQYSICYASETHSLTYHLSSMAARDENIFFLGQERVRLGDIFPPPLP